MSMVEALFKKKWLNFAPARCADGMRKEPFE